MSRLLATFPGRFGDLLWALPTVRALSRRVGQPIDLQIAGEFASIVPLLEQQAYLGAITADPSWSLTPPDEWRAPDLSLGLPLHDTIFHLGYRGWPSRPLPLEVLHTLDAQIQDPAITAIRDSELALDEPWITVDEIGPSCTVAVGFTEAWFELKLGLLAILSAQLPMYAQLTPPGSRWTTEGRHLVSIQADDWCVHARAIRNSQVFLGDCSALHVLACALGTPVVLMEPMDARWNDIFYPYGKVGPQVTLVLGNDGQPTFDARAAAAAVHHTLDRTP